MCVTKSIYTEDEDFAGNDICIKDLDNGLDGPITVNYLSYKLSSSSYKEASPTANADMFSANSQMDKFAKNLGQGSVFLTNL